MAKSKTAAENAAIEETAVAERNNSKNIYEEGLTLFLPKSLKNRMRP